MFICFLRNVGKLFALQLLLDLPTLLKKKKTYFFVLVEIVEREKFISHMHTHMPLIPTSVMVIYDLGNLEIYKCLIKTGERNEK